MDASEAEDEFLESLEYSLESIEASKEYANSEDEIIMKVYINSKGEVVGRDIVSDNSYESVEIKYYMPESGGNYGMELSMLVYNNYYDYEELCFMLEGKGKKSSSKLSGKFDLYGADELEIAEITVTDLNT